MDFACLCSNNLTYMQELGVNFVIFIKFIIYSLSLLPKKTLRPRYLPLRSYSIEISLITKGTVTIIGMGF